jgi:hypothetical protein
MDVKNALLDVLSELVSEKQASYKHDLPANFTLTTNFMHGPTGIFGAAGLDRDVFSTRVVPRGLLAPGILPARGVTDTNPITAYLTGITAPTGSEPSTPCVECIKAGNIKSCYQGTVFGLVCRETDELNLADVGKSINRGEFFDLRMVNDPLLAEGALWVPDSVPKAAQDVLNREVLARWLTLGAAFEQTLARMVFTGNPANNVGTGYAEFRGLELLVATGYVDVLNGTSCPSLDADIKNFGHLSAESNAASLFNHLTWLYRFVKHNATTMGFMPVQWAFVMQDSLFRIITNLWPCVYASFQCNATANDINNNIDGMQARVMADEMYNGRFLTIDGERIPVILDDAVPMQTSADGFNVPPGSFDSDIYLLPFTVRGGLPVFYMEYFDYQAPNAVMQAISDGGRWLWTKNQTRFCVSWVSRIEPRLRLLTPHLAGRLQNVRWTPLQMFRQPLTNQGYFVDGGNVYLSNSPYSRGVYSQ